MKLSRWTIALYMALVFACGAVVGAFGTVCTPFPASAQQCSAQSGRVAQEDLAEMKSRLKLSDDQVGKTELDHGRNARRFVKCGRRYRAGTADDPEKAATRQDPLHRSDDQQAECEKMLKERRAARRNRTAAGDLAPALAVLDLTP